MKDITIKIDKTLDDVAEKYGWDDGTVGLPVQHNVLTKAIKGREFGVDRMIRFRVKRKRYDFVIDPKEALRIAKKYNAYFTLKTYEGLVLYVVIPDSKCVRVSKLLTN